MARNSTQPSFSKGKISAFVQSPSPPDLAYWEDAAWLGCGSQQTSFYCSVVHHCTKCPLLKTVAIHTHLMSSNELLQIKHVEHNLECEKYQAYVSKYYNFYLQK